MIRYDKPGAAMTNEQRVLGVAWLPLDQAALCRACRKFYDAKEVTCPACGDARRRLVADVLGAEGATA